MTEGLRQEARGRGVPLRVSAISPGVVETEFFTVRGLACALGMSLEIARDVLRTSWAWRRCYAHNQLLP